MNHVSITGHLTRDPKLKTLSNGTDVCEFSIANNKRWKDNAGNVQEKVSFIDFRAWANTGKTIAKYFAKGSKILIEGKLEQDTWEKDGEKKQRLVVVVDSFEFVDSKKDKQDKPTQQSEPQLKPGQKYVEDDDEQDIPF